VPYHGCGGSSALLAVAAGRNRAAVGHKREPPARGAGGFTSGVWSFPRGLRVACAGNLASASEGVKAEAAPSVIRWAPPLP
jgi:hypothetical protein